MKISKDKWIEYTIEDVVSEISDRIANPSNSQLHRFVGLENFDAGSIKIKRWSSTENIVSAMKLFQTGDVLFARRNAYLRRASMIDFDGICSGDAMVLRSKGIIDVILFTLIINTDRFWNFAISNAAGTMSKRVKWRDLVKYRFKIPKNVEEQKDIIDVFQSLEQSIERIEKQEIYILTLQKTLVDGLVNKNPIFGNIFENKRCELTTIGKIAECDKRYQEHNKIVERFVGLENIEPNNYIIQGWGNISDGTTFTKIFSKGDILFGKRRAYLKKVAIADFDGICSNDILVIRAINKKITQELLPFYISSEAFINHAIKTSAGSLSPRTKWKDLSVMEISIPDLETQGKIVKILNNIQDVLQQLKQQKSDLKILKQKLLNEILG